MFAEMPALFKDTKWADRHEDSENKNRSELAAGP
jgi:hypothetical protein